MNLGQVYDRRVLRNGGKRGVRHHEQRRLGAGLYFGSAVALIGVIRLFFEDPAV